jgi:glycosyltransferase involved in cell wall biosynthesis
LEFPKISIITPSFNQGQYIGQTIESVLDQGYPNLEFMIIDGGSSDNTMSVVKGYQKHLDWIVSEPDDGQSHAINKGLSRVSGELFNWINSDDYLELGALHAIGESALEFPNVEVFCGNTRCFYDEDNSDSHTYQTGVKSTVEETIMSLVMNQPGTFYRSSTIKDLGGVNQDLNYVFDNELFCRYVAKNGLQKIHFMQELLCHFRLHKRSKSVGDGYHLFNDELQSIYTYLYQNGPGKGTLKDFFSTNKTYNAQQKWNFNYGDWNRFNRLFAKDKLVRISENNPYSAVFGLISQLVLHGDFAWNRKNRGAILHTVKGLVGL